MSVRLANARANLRASQIKCERSELPKIARQVQRSLGGASGWCADVPQHGSVSLDKSSVAPRSLKPLEAGPPLLGRDARTATGRRPDGHRLRSAAPRRATAALPRRPPEQTHRPPWI